MKDPDFDPVWAKDYRNAVGLLRRIQTDYHRATKELHAVSSYFRDREAAVGRQLRLAIDHAQGKRNGRLVCESALAPVMERPSPDQNLRLQTGESNRPILEVYTLGKFHVRVGWNVIEHWHSLKAKSLLKYLIGHHGRPVSKDVLMEALWPGCELPLASNNLKAAVRSLRQTLSSVDDTGGSFTWIIYQDSNYTVNSEADLWTDMEQFEYHWHTARLLEKQNKIAESIRELEVAETLYRGDYLEDDLYEDWTSLRREALKDTYLAILGRLADHSMRDAEHEDCIVYCQKILANDPCREDAYRRLMCCHSRLGQRNRAISWYRLCEKTIRAELDVGPARSTTALYDKLLKDEYI
ncbi:MAG: winged helix-turn-helix domain-containing protein [Dehalococcoidia bacterium]|nr:winged helix-turn-helix domain-containing protein [Dehalococcoidia bacterium]